MLTSFFYKSAKSSCYLENRTTKAVSREFTKTVSRGLIIIIILFTSSSWALSSDSKLPAEIDSNSAVCTHQKSNDVCIYSGNAKLNQGTTHLQAQKISIHKTGNKVNKIIASGKRSSYGTMDDNQQQINTIADLITIDYDKSTILLEHNGLLIIGQDKYRGPTIKYKF